MTAANLRSAPVTAETRLSAETWTSNPMNFAAKTATSEVEELNALRRQELHDLTIGRIKRRAERLWQDGYEKGHEHRGETFAYFTVISPARDHYLVTLSDTPDDELFGDGCTCPSYQKYGECKHHLAILWDEQNRLADEQKCREWEEAEELRNFFGFDKDDY